MAQMDTVEVADAYCTVTWHGALSAAARGPTCAMISTPMATKTLLPVGAPPTSADLLQDLVDGFRQSAESIVPWFLEQMPSTYFQDTPLEDQKAHLRAIVTARTSGRPLDLTLRSQDGRSWTAMRPGNRAGVLAEIVATLPMEPPLRAAKIHTANDGSLVVDTFEFGQRVPFDSADPAQSAKGEAIAAWASEHHPDWLRDQLLASFRNCSAEYVLTLSPFRYCQQRAFAQQLSGSEGALVELEQESDPTLSRITVAVANASTRTMLERMAIILSRAGISIVRAYLDEIQDPPHGAITLLCFVVQTTDRQQIDPKGESWRQTRLNLLRIKWIDFRVLELQGRHSELDLPRAEAVNAYAALVHQALAPINPYAYDRERVLATFEAHLPIAIGAIDLMLARFDPEAPLSDAEYGRRSGRLREETLARADLETTRATLLTLLDAVDATLRTNFFLASRFGLSLRLKPELLRAERRPETPYGVFFVSGRGYCGFHVRFKEIARGGLRIVRPTSAAQFDREGERLYDEVYGLAWAQQQKNKDIPEGGAKAAILIESVADPSRCMKSFVDSLLDLITPEPQTKRLVLDRFGHQELLYLGPDELITPEHINWIVARAARRGYPLASAFMSSKPGAGINHKVYGVTSEGVNIFLRMGLLSRGIDPAKQPFTVKITGGPDGDVAGNMMRILDRDYGANARVVGVADGSGCGEDPDGLDHSELLRLFQAGLPIASFDPKRLSPRGRIVPVSAPDGASLRNSMHNRLEADAFIPGGGRPATINDQNWKHFLKADGTPSGSVIVEGANLFLTPEARVKLSAAGALIFKDSSANKCGVICSSYEIAASMLLSEEQFLAIKSVFVEQVLEKLRQFARREASLLIAEGRRHPTTPLPEISVRLSAAVNSAADAIQSAMGSWPQADLPRVDEVIRDHLPAVLMETVGERVYTGLPRPYLSWMAAKHLASRIVYREGIDFFAGMDPTAIGAIVLGYLRTDGETRQLLAEVRASGLPHAERIAALLERAGTRAALMET